MNHTCHFLPSRSWSSFTDPGRMEGWVGLGGGYISSRYDLDLWPLILKTFSNLFTHVTNLYARFHWNPPNIWGDIAPHKIMLTTDGRPDAIPENPMPLAACWSRRQTLPAYRILSHAFCSCDLDLDPMTLTYESDTDIPKTCLRTKKWISSDNRTLCRRTLRSINMSLEQFPVVEWRCCDF